MKTFRQKMIGARRMRRDLSRGRSRLTTLHDVIRAVQRRRRRASASPPATKYFVAQAGGSARNDRSR